MKRLEINAENKLTPADTNVIIKFASWVTKINLPFVIITAGMIVMLLWAGAFKMTAPGAEGIAPLVNNSPLISWNYKIFGVYHGSDLIGITEWIAAVLIFIGLFKPQAGVMGGAIAVLMFFTTSTMLITTPDALIKVGGLSYMNNLGLFLFKDILNLGASFYLISKFGHKAIIAQHKNN